MDRLQVQVLIVVHFVAQWLHAEPSLDIILLPFNAVADLLCILLAVVTLRTIIEISNFIQLSSLTLQILFVELLCQAKSLHGDFHAHQIFLSTVLSLHVSLVGDRFFISLELLAFLIFEQPLFLELN
jgi:hypothetical protein